MLHELIEKNRSFRRFYENEAVPLETLKELVDLARLSASGANIQPLKYFLSCDPETNATIFPYLGWAGYLDDWDGPEEGERPSAYVIVIRDSEISRSSGCDHGIASQSILLGAAEKGLGGCMIGSVERSALRSALNISERYDIMLVLAIGKPKETVVIETVGKDGNIKYWRDKDGVHHVPKRSLSDLIL